jgi:hypothetical protein
MAGTPSKVAARNFVFEISDGLGSPTYYQIEGLKTLDRSEAAVKTDVTDFASLGNHEHWVMERTRSLKLVATRQKATGQKLVEVLADATAAASLRSFRLTFPALPGESVPEKWTFAASALWTAEGGSNNDVDKWEMDIEISGAITKTLGS